MTSYALPAPPQASVAIDGSTDRFAVRRIICVGRNYEDHVVEMGGPKGDPPIFFTKPADAVVDSGTALPYPLLTSHLEHEVELVLALGSGGSAIAEADALACIWGTGVGIDFTRRDLQAAAKAKGNPWDWAKGFDQSAPCGALRPASASLPERGARIELLVNGAVRQSASLAMMIWSPAEIIAQASRAIELKAGDLIYTGTPAGVGRVERGDALVARIDGLPELTVSILP